MKTIFLFLFGLTGTGLLADNYYWVGGTGHWKDYGTHWATSSGGNIFRTRVPSPNDTVIFDSLSFTPGGDTIFTDSTILYCHTMIWKGVRYQPVFITMSSCEENILKIYGSLLLDTGMTWQYGGRILFESITASDSILFRGNRLNQAEFSHTGTYDLLDSARFILLRLTNGVLRSRGNYILTSTFYTSGFASVELDTSLVRVNYVAFLSSPGSVDADSSHFIITGVGNNQVSFDTPEFNFIGGGNIFGHITSLDYSNFSGTITAGRIDLDRGGYFSDNSVTDTLRVGAGYTLMIGAGNTLTVTDSIEIPGDCRRIPEITSSIPGVQAYLDKPSGFVLLNRAVVEDVSTSGAAQFILSSGALSGTPSGWTLVNVQPPQTLYWVGGNGNWSDSLHWSVSSGGPGGSCVPLPTDDVMFDAASFLSTADTVTMDVERAYCDDFTWNNPTGSPLFKGNVNGVVNIFSNINLAPNLSTTGLNMEMKSVIPSFCNSNGAGARSLTINGPTSFTLQSSVNTAVLNIVRGSLSTNNNQVNTGLLLQGGFSPALNLGGSLVNCGAILINFGSIFSAGTSVINVAGKLSAPGTWFNVVNFTGSASMTGANTFRKVTVAADLQIFGSNSFDSLLFQNPGSVVTLYPGLTQSVNMHLSASGNCAGFIEFTSGSPGTQSYFSKNGSSVAFNWCILQDLHALGSAAFNAVNSYAGYNVSGWNVTPIPPVPFYWVGGTGDWNDPNHWSLSSGGAPGSCLPSPANDVYFDANSFNGPNQQVNFNPRNGYCRNMDWTGVTGTPSFNPGISTSKLKIYGSETLSPNMQSGGIRSYFRSNIPGNIITSSGQRHGYMKFDGIGGAWTFADSVLADSIHVMTGDLSTSGKKVMVGTFVSDTTLLRSIDLDTSHVLASSIIFNRDVNFTLDADSAFIEMRGKKFHGGGHRYHTVQFNVTGHHYDPDTMLYLVFRGMTQTHATIHADTVRLENPGKQVIFSSGDSLVFTGLTSTSSPSLTIGLEGSSSGWQAYFIKLQDTLCLDFLEIRDINAGGGATYYAGYESTDISNNAGWIWNSCDPGSPVWPGDANWDLTADNFDILAIGVAFGSTGPVRPSANNNWTAQPCPDWSGQLANTANLKHSDCNGDGTVDFQDTIAVFLNYGNTHPPKLAPPSTTISYVDLYMTSQVYFISASAFVTLKVNLGTSSTPADTVYGIAYTLNYDSSKIVPGTFGVSYANSWLVQNDPQVHIEKHPWTSELDIATCRTDQQNRSGNGEITEITFQVAPNAAGDLYVWFTDTRCIQADETEVPLKETGIHFFILGMEEEQGAGPLQVFPNPSDGNFTILIPGGSEPQALELLDLSGRVVYRSQEIEKDVHQVNFEHSLPAGYYQLRLYTAEGIYYQKLSIQH